MARFRTRSSLLAALVGLLTLVAPAGADHLAGVRVIDSDQLKAWIDQGKTMLLVDSRVASEYKEGHLPGAVNLPEPAMEKLRDRLPRDRKLPIVFYCNGWPECKKSHEACTKALQWGYTEVYWFREGTPAWREKGYPIE